MTAESARRGIDLVDAGRVLARPGWFARVWAGPLEKVLDRIDTGLVSGAIEAVLPDGSQRLLGGRAPGFVAKVDLRSWRALLRLATGGSAGWYQAWEAGEWDSPDPVPLFALFMANAASLGDTGRAHGPWRLMARALHFLHRNTRSGARRNIHAHYDLGNDFYALWLDPAMVYSSARFTAEGQDLASAQEAKLDSIAQRIEGAKSVLEIGCGWGALAQHLSERGMAVTAISLSDEQLAWARERQSEAIDFRKQDYRDVTGQYDAVVSVEMVEAVGREYWADWFDCIARCLKPGGRAAIQFISIREDLFPAYASSADFIQTHVFPGGMLVSEAEFQRLAAERGLSWESREGFAPDYAETLRLWREAFDRAVAESRLPASFDERFVRLWRFYLMYCEGGFRGRGIDVAQVTLVKN